MSQTKRAYKYRFYPTDEQARLLARTFGCVRVVYNWALHTRSTAYKERGEKLYYNHLSALLPALKEEFPWLKEVSSVPIQQSLRNLDKAFKDRRRDYQHQLSTRIVRENQVICIESLAVKNMVKNHCLAKSISDVGWGEFVRQLEYKSEWYGRTLVKIDRWYPSSKTCHTCKYVLEEFDLDVRTWECPKCKMVHDRDTNAARNILAEGLSVAACGGSVRPVRAKARRATPHEAGNSQS